MPRTLTPRSSLETLRKEAKRWLKALRADMVLRSAWGGDQAAAERILARWPEIATHDLYIAAATGNLAEVERRLAADPGAAPRKGGPLDWEPLLYVAYARLPGGERHALALVTALLDHGADANARHDDGWGNPFKVLTGVIGHGEGNRPPHPHAATLAALLIQRGADPYDSQALYNTSIADDDPTWLDILWTHSGQRGRLPKWRETSAPSIGGNVAMNALDYLLGNAVAFNHLRRAEWLLRHGANAGGVHAYSGRPLREEALICGHADMAELLVRHGAEARPLAGPAAFQAACMQLDRAAARGLAAAHPQCLLDPAPMLTAARQGRADVVALLLELGMDVDIADDTGQRGLHNAVAGGAMDVVRLLVAHGAEIDRPTTRFGGAMGFAAHFGRREIAAFLAPLSRDVVNLTRLGMAERLGELLDAEPALANAVAPRAGVTPLFCLPDDEDAATAMAALLLARGADPGFVGKAGLTAEQDARRRGLVDAADLMAGGEGIPSPRLQGEG